MIDMKLNGRLKKIGREKKTGKLGKKKGNNIGKENKQK